MSTAEVSVQPLPLVRGAAAGLERIVEVGWQGTEEERVTVSVTSAEGKSSVEGDSRAGPNGLRLAIPEPVGPTTVRAEVRPVGGVAAACEAIVGPVRPWHIFVVHHSHLDLGYTDVQSHILRLHLDFIDEAVAFCDRTRELPENSRFRWNFEVAYPLTLYCRQRGTAALRRLGRCLQDGQMEVCALTANLHAETCAYEELIGALGDAHALGKRFGVAIRSAMYTDVPGLPWTMAQLLAADGVRYLSMAPNNNRAPLHESRAFDRPFWWRTPDGARLLTWFTDDPRQVYQEGNHLGFTDSYEAVLQALPVKLVGLEAAGFPYDALHLRCQGEYADNGPPNLRISEVAQRWNREWIWPQVRVACNRDFFAYMERHWAREIPEYSGDWPDWWVDGTGSAAREMGLVRQAHSLVAVASAASALAEDVPAGVSEDLAAAEREMLLFDEHTWGAALPEQDALRGFGSQGRQWAYKSAHAHRAHAAALVAASAAVDRLAASLRTGELPAVFLFNATGAARRAPVRLELPRWLGVTEKTGLRLIDPQNGRQVPYEWIPGSIHDRASLRFVSPEVPALGYRRLDLEVGGSGASSTGRRQGGDAASEMENAWLRMAVDPERGGLGSLVHRADGVELVDGSSPYGLNTLITDRYRKDDEFELQDRLSGRYPGVPLEIAPATRSPVDRTLTYRWPGNDDADPGECTLRLYDDLPGLYVENTISKRPAQCKEGLYFAFPFSIDGLERIHYDLPGGAAVLGSEQLPGSLTDWPAVSAGVWLEGRRSSVLWGTVDACLVQFGTIRTARPPATPARPGHLYSYVANNLWNTNFAPRQGGELQFRYVVAATVGVDDRAFAAFGQAVQQSLAAVVVPAKQQGHLSGPGGTLVDVAGETVLAEVLRSDGQGGWILRLRNCAPHTDTVDVGVPAGCSEAIVTSPSGDVRAFLPSGHGTVRVAVQPHAMVHLRFRAKG